MRLRQHAPVAIATVASFATDRAEEAAPKPHPYKPIAVELPQPYKDPSFTAFLKQIADIAERKDRAALAKLVAANFFWTTDDGKDIADKARSATTTWRAHSISIIPTPKAGTFSPRSQPR